MISVLLLGVSLVAGNIVLIQQIGNGNRCLDAYQRHKNGGVVHMWSCSHSNANQKWIYNPTTRIIQQVNGNCLDEYQHKSGGKVHMWACSTSNSNQKWSYNPSTKMIHSLSANVCLDSYQNKNGGHVHMWACNTANANQKWNLVASPVACLPNKAYHKGFMTNHDAGGNTPRACHKKCMDAVNCYFWDYDGHRFCRLRNKDGGGPISHAGYYGGVKGCTFKPRTTGCTNVRGWYDRDGSRYNCAWYAKGRRCQRFGHSYARNGHTANSACCACGKRRGRRRRRKEGLVSDDVLSKMKLLEE